MWGVISAVMAVQSVVVASACQAARRTASARRRSVRFRSRRDLRCWRTAEFNSYCRAASRLRVWLVEVRRQCSASVPYDIGIPLQVMKVGSSEQPLSQEPDRTARRSVTREKSARVD